VHGADLWCDGAGPHDFRRSRLLNPDLDARVGEVRYKGMSGPATTASDDPAPSEAREPAAPHAAHRLPQDNRMTPKLPRQPDPKSANALPSLDNLAATELAIPQ